MASLMVRKKFPPSESLPPQSSNPSSSQSRSQGCAGAGKGEGKPKHESRFHYSSTRGSSDSKDTTNEGFSSNLTDLVRYATLAHRKDMGNIIWVGWSPAHKKPSRLRCGSHLIMVTKEGMLHMYDAMHHGVMARDHWDVSLLNWLSIGTVAQLVGACYTYPQMGGFYRHESGCEPDRHGAGTAGRPGAWEFDNPASGTRQSTDPKQRGKWLIQWREEIKNREWFALPRDSELILDEYKWKSISEPTAAVKKEPGEKRKTPAEWLGDPPAECEPPRSKRSRRGQRQHDLRNKLRVWVDSVDQASSAKTILNPLWVCCIHWEEVTSLIFL